jgi:hypothetical protein
LFDAVAVQSLGCSPGVENGLAGAGELLLGCRVQPGAYLDPIAGPFAQVKVSPSKGGARLPPITGCQCRHLHMPKAVALAFTLGIWVNSNKAARRDFP